MAVLVSSSTSLNTYTKQVILYGLLGDVIVNTSSFPGISIQVSIPNLLIRLITKSINKIQSNHTALQSPVELQNQLQSTLESFYREFTLLRDITSINPSHISSQSVSNRVEFICIALNSEIVSLIQTVFPPSETLLYDMLQTADDAIAKYPEYFEVLSPHSSADSSPHPTTPIFDDRISTIPLCNDACGRVIYLTGDSGANNFATISHLGITHILNVSDCIPNYYKDSSDITYMRVPITDCGSVELKEFFPMVFEFINNAFESSGRILVHCFAGKSRSASFVIAYLMKYQKMNYTNAFQYVKSHRAVVEPNLGFVLQLYAFEKTL